MIEDNSLISSFLQIGNAYTDYTDRKTGTYDHYWTSALISDETHQGILATCNFSSSDAPRSDACNAYESKAAKEKGKVFTYDIYAPLCGSNSTSPSVCEHSTSIFTVSNRMYIKSKSLNLK